jgi:hypothetical protein
MKDTSRAARKQYFAEGEDQDRAQQTEGRGKQIG